jgi:hypothetical protein
VELAARTAAPQSRSLSQSNKVHRVTTLRRVAVDLGVDEQAIWDASDGLDTEDGLIWVYDLGDEHTLAFTDDGIVELQSALRGYR